jgi:hypothetical protein
MEPRWSHASLRGSIVICSHASRCVAHLQSSRHAPPDAHHQVSFGRVKYASAVVQTRTITPSGLHVRVKCEVLAKCEMRVKCERRVSRRHHYLHRPPDARACSPAPMYICICMCSRVPRARRQQLPHARARECAHTSMYVCDKGRPHTHRYQHTKYVYICIRALTHT